MPSRDSSVFEAVYFISGNHVSRHMLFSEFEALLDGIGSLPDYTDEEAKAVYALINKAGHIEALVFFLLYFDEEGRADSGWNVQVERLADISGSGPDLGGGPIRLACRSQCAINWHQKELWDPDMNPGTNTFIALKKAVEENRLRFSFEESVQEVPTLAPAPAETQDSENVDEVEGPLDSDKRTKLARILKEQRLRIRTLEAQAEDVSDSAERELRILNYAYKNEIQELKQNVEQLRVANERFKEKLSLRNEQYLSLQDKASQETARLKELEQRLENAGDDERESIESQKAEAEVVLLKEQLARRDIDLAYRDEREEQLRMELEELKESVQSGEGEPILNQLKELEVVFVAYHPGAGHITMTHDDILEYVKNPTAYAASKCFVTEEHYRKWLEHYESAVCQSVLPSGSKCSKAIIQINAPSEFEPGHSDWCSDCLSREGRE